MEGSCHSAPVSTPGICVCDLMETVPGVMCSDTCSACEGFAVEVCEVGGGEVNRFKGTVCDEYELAPNRGS